MKKIILILSSLFLCFILLSNAAMPGFWNMGGSSTFMPFFAEDSIHLGKIQMERERICILLEKGYAVVKGEYWMKNLTSDTIQLQTGYPINGSLVDQRVYHVNFRDLHRLKVKVNSKEVNTKRLGIDSTKKVNRPPQIADIDNWYVWESTFLPDTLTKLSVYFMVNTNLGNLRKGYAKDHHNGFLYVLESGRAWAKKIEEGSLLIQLGKTLKSEDILGISPQNQFKFNQEKNQLLWEFNKLEPDSSHNVLIRYAERIEDFDFDKVTKSSETFYQTVDKLSKSNPNSLSFESFIANDFQVHDWKGGSTFAIVMFFAIFGMPLMIIILGGLTLWYFIRKGRRNKEKN